MSSPCHFLADRAETDNRHFAAVQAPWPCVVCQFILDPSAFALRVEHEGESARKNEKTSHHVLGNRHSLDSARIRHSDAAGFQFRKWKNTDSGGRRMNP